MQPGISTAAPRRPARRVWITAFLMALGASLAAAFSPATVLNALAPLWGVRRETGLRYGDHPRQLLDLYVPKAAAGAPIAVFIYGGSWQSGSRETYQFVAAALARRGIIVAVPDYTVYPEAKFPRFLEDAAAAAAWTADWARRNAGPHGTRADRLVLMGHSAGAHIAAMLAFDGRWLAPHGLDPRRDLAGFVGLAGPYDFLPIKDPIIKLIFAHPEPEATQPISFVTGGEVPTFLGVAPSDTVVRPGNSERLGKRLEANGARVTLQVYPWTNHLSLIGSFSPLLRPLAGVADDVAGFMHRLPPASNAR
jgi:acetyl esterase/lipase